MKKLVIVLMLLALSACKIDVNGTDLDVVFEKDLEDISLRRNNYTEYVDYYLPSDVHQTEDSLLSESFEYNDSKFLMDVNISGIINNKYYKNTSVDDGFFDESKLVYRKQSTYRDMEDGLFDYIFSIYLEDNEYLICFNSKDLIFYGITNKNDLDGLSSRILLMAKAAKVNEEKVVEDYSNKEVIDYEKKQVNLFETVMPVNGNINDFIINKNDSGE